MRMAANELSVRYSYNINWMCVCVCVRWSLENMIHNATKHETFFIVNSASLSFSLVTPKHASSRALTERDRKRKETKIAFTLCSINNIRSRYIWPWLHSPQSHRWMQYFGWTLLTISNLNFVCADASLYNETKKKNERYDDVGAVSSIVMETVHLVASGIENFGCNFPIKMQSSKMPKNWPISIESNSLGEVQRPSFKCEQCLLSSSSLSMLSIFGACKWFALLYVASRCYVLLFIIMHFTK